jgi:hypothetical protein
MAIEARHLLAPVALAGGVMLAAAGASAGCDVPFRVSVERNLLAHDILCQGPWNRGTCFDLGRVRPGENVQFYCAEDTAFPPWGDWSCSVRDTSNPLLRCNQAPVRASTDFNLQKSGPNPVDLRVTRDPISLRLVNPLLEDGAAAAEVVQAASFLGHADADPGAAAGGGGQPGGGGGDDVDSWGFEAAAAKTGVVRLEGDDTAGYAGGAATLRLESGGAVLAQASGALPLELSGQVGAGTHQIVVVEHGAGAATPEASFRGHYLLTVTPQGGAEGVLLDPRPDVEPHE